MFNRKRLNLTLMLVLLGISGCSSMNQTGLSTGAIDSSLKLQKADNKSLVTTFNALTDMKAYPVDEHVTRRDTMLKSLGVRSGMQFGYQKQLINLQDKISKQSNYLDQIFNFNFILSYANKNSPAINLLPPVMLIADNYVQSNNSKMVTISKVNYQIFSQASLVSVVPSWKDYLIKEIPQPEAITGNLLPHDSHEQVVWKDAIKLGWKLGIKQANQEMDYRINSLNRDYNGMLLYVKLLQLGKVVSPYVAYSHQSVVGDKENMSVNQNIYRITNDSALVLNPNKWKFQTESSIGTNHGR